MAIHAQNSVSLNTKPAKTSLLGGHFIYRVDTSQGTLTPSSANIIENVNDSPALWGYNTHIGAGGIKLRYNQIDLSTWTKDGVTLYYPKYNSSNIPIQGDVAAILNTTGLKVQKGGVIAGTAGQNGFVYLSSEDYQLKDSTHNGFTINGHTPTAAGIDDKLIDDPAWREIIGTKFGVDSEGNLYASGANISGVLTVQSGSNVYTKIESDNNYEVAGEVAKYITYISAEGGIKVHNANDLLNYVKINSDGLEVFKNDTSIASFGATARIGESGSSRFLTNADSLEAYDGNNNKYFEVSANGLSWGSNTAATTTQVTNAATTATSYITYINATDGIKIHNTNDSSNYLQLNSTAVSIFKGGTEKIRLEAENLRLGDDSEYANINSNGLQVYQNDTSIASFGDTTIIGNTNRRNHIEIGDKYFYMKSNAINANIFICFKDFREDNGKAKIKQNFTYSSGIAGVGFFNLGATADSSEPIIIKVNDVETTSQLYVSGSRLYRKTGNTLQEGDQIYVEYYTNSPEAQAFTLGLREDIDNPLGSSPGIRSFTVGNNDIASGTYSVAFGYRNKASGSYSLASGDTNEAQGTGSVAFGQNNKTYGNYSGAIGSYLYTTNWNNLVCGMYNDNTSTAHFNKRFEVGTGNYSNQRESGFFVTSNGETHLKTLYALASGITSGYDSYATWNAADSTGYSRLCKTGSSERYKEDISLVTSESLQPKLLYNLPVRQFRYKEGVLVKEDPYNLTRPLVIGFIAEEVDKYFPAACVKQNGIAEDWNVRAMIPAMLSLIQKQHQQIEDLTNRIIVLENK